MGDWRKTAILCTAAALSATAAAASFADLPAPAPSSAPATAPATQPALVRRDSPRNALITHAIAMSRGDSAAVRDSYVVETPEERALVDAFARMADVIPHLRAAAERKYGKDGFTAIGFGAIFDDEVRRLWNAQEKKEQATEGEAMTVLPPGPGTAWITLVKNGKTAGQWKISVARTFPINLQRRTLRLDAQATAYEELAREIDAGKYPLAIDARAAGREKVAAAQKKLQEQNSPATTRSIPQSKPEPKP